MGKIKYYVGIDIANKDFTASIFTSPNQSLKTLKQVANTIEGFERLHAWLQQQGVDSNNCVICMEATGVYGEHLSYWFSSKGYSVAVEPPLKVKRAFSDKAHKNDTVDSQKIAQYAYRFADELRIWRPKEDVLEQIRVLLSSREQLVQQKTALSNTLITLKRKVVQTPLANDIYQHHIQTLKADIKRIEKEIEELIKKHPDYKRLVGYLRSIPGIGLLLAANLLVITNGFQEQMTYNYRKIASYIGICPYEHSSGTSVYRKPRISHYGPSRLRKLLHLAARSVVEHKKTFRHYYLRKIAEGKPKKLVINNVANKLLRIICGVVKNQKPYIENYVSMHPNLL